MSKAVEVKTVERDYLKAMPMPQPMGPRHNPIPHETALSTVERELLAFNLLPTSQEIALTHDDGRMIATLTLSDRELALEEYVFQILVRNSTDQHWSYTIGCGGRVWACWNGMMTAEYIVGTKNTTNVFERLPRMVASATGKAIGKATDQRMLVSKMQDFSINDQEASYVITQAVREGQLPSSKVLPVLEQWHEPELNEFKPRNVWSLYNGFTQVNKTRSLEAQHDPRLMAFFLSTLQWNQRGERVYDVEATEVS